MGSLSKPIFIDPDTLYFEQTFEKFRCNAARFFRNSKTFLSKSNTIDNNVIVDCVTVFVNGSKKYPWKRFRGAATFALGDGYASNNISPSLIGEECVMQLIICYRQSLLILVYFRLFCLNMENQLLLLSVENLFLFSVFSMIRWKDWRFVAVDCGYRSLVSSYTILQHTIYSACSPVRQMTLLSKYFFPLVILLLPERLVFRFLWPVGARRGFCSDFARSEKRMCALPLDGINTWVALSFNIYVVYYEQLLWTNYIGWWKV